MLPSDLNHKLPSPQVTVPFRSRWHELLTSGDVRKVASNVLLVDCRKSSRIGNLFPSYFCCSIEMLNSWCLVFDLWIRHEQYFILWEFEKKDWRIGEEKGNKRGMTSWQEREIEMCDLIFKIVLSLCHVSVP